MLSGIDELQSKMAEIVDTVDSFLRELPRFLEQVERQLHCENINVLEHIRRRLDDNNFVLSAIIHHCIEQETCNEVVRSLREIHDKVFGYVERYNELCGCDLEGEDPIEVSEQCRFPFHQIHSGLQGRPRIEAHEETLLELYNIYRSWSAVARETGVTYRTVLRRRQEYGLQIANRVGPRSTYSDISEQHLDVIREILQVMPDAGESYIIGALRSRGINVQRWRIRQAIQITDPISRALRRTFAVIRRTYSVPCPNSLW